MCGKCQIGLMATCIRKRLQIGVLSQHLLRLKTTKTKMRVRAMPDMIFVDSKNIEAIGYDIETLELHVRFLKSGETYIYDAVEEWRYQEFQQADSKGQYLNANIKPNYQYAKL